MPDQSLYGVLLLNDDYTPMEFVVHALREVFNLDEKAAQELMMRVHNAGCAECGAYPHAEAQKKRPMWWPWRDGTNIRCSASSSARLHNKPS